MREDYTHICLFLDRSGSMESTKGHTMEAVNKFIDEQKALPGKATFQLIQWDDKYESWAPTSLKRAPKLNEENYVPRGMTALYYSLWRGVTETGAWLRKKAEEKRPAKVVFVVITDGEHNTDLNKDGEPFPPTVSQAEVAALVKHQQEKYSWSFVYLGANQNAFLVAESIGVKKTSALTYAQNTKGIGALGASITRSVADYRAGATMDSCFAAADYELQIASGVDESVATPDGTSTGNTDPSGFSTPKLQDLTGFIITPHIPLVPPTPGTPLVDDKTPQGVPVKKVTRSATSNNTSNS